MGVQKQTLSAGNGVDFPKKNDTVTMEYTGWLYDASKPDNKGTQPREHTSLKIDYDEFLARFGLQIARDLSTSILRFDSSVGKGNFDTKIGQGRVIKGWDEGIIGTTSAEGMSLGEKATLTISSDYGYGNRDVQLIAINGKRA
ncbi:hypothetical protein BLS_005278 [Venturia inaequalis]|uniref:peptidylprolyl isomerase n=1 Tax=Venturia inaequalis TaxID=5025 RepID=A0A8H3V4B8_VENIN|nr:hypothetical protein BLS_005278 [Venturia inaequalis]